MLRIACTENKTGVTLSGDWTDLDTLYDAVCHVVGEEDCYEGYEDAGTYLMSLCYELRHARQGDRETFQSEDGSPYYATNLLWTEILFDACALCDFITLTRGKKSYLRAPLPAIDEQEKGYLQEGRQYVLSRMDQDIAVVRFFQSLVWAELKKTIGEKRYRRLPETMELRSFWGTASDFKGYCFPYLDMLGRSYLRAKPERRASYLATVAEKILLKDYEYDEIKKEVAAYAKENNIPQREVIVGSHKWPEEIVW